MKNKKGQTIYSEEIYFPCQFRTRLVTVQLWPRWLTVALVPEEGLNITQCIELGARCRMPSILMGWVQNEVHIQWGHQSLN